MDLPVGRRNGILLTNSLEAPPRPGSTERETGWKNRGPVGNLYSQKFAVVIVTRYIVYGTGISETIVSSISTLRLRFSNSSACCNHVLMTE